MTPDDRQSQPGADEWLGALTAPLMVVLAGLCCGGPLVAAALIATGAGAWLSAHGFQLGGIAALAVASVLLFRWRLMTRGGP